MRWAGAEAGGEGEKERRARDARTVFQNYSGGGGGQAGRSSAAKSRASERASESGTDALGLKVVELQGRRTGVSSGLSSSHSLYRPSGLRVWAASESLGVRRGRSSWVWLFKLSRPDAHSLARRPEPTLGSNSAANLVQLTASARSDLLLFNLDNDRSACRRHSLRSPPRPSPRPPPTPSPRPFPHPPPSDLRPPPSSGRNTTFLSPSPSSPASSHRRGTSRSSSRMSSSAIALRSFGLSSGAWTSWAKEGGLGFSGIRRTAGRWFAHFSLARESPLG